MRNGINLFGNFSRAHRVSRTFVPALPFAAIALVMLIGSPTTVFAQTGKAEAFFKIFASGTYHMKARMSGADGTTTDMESYVKGGMMATIVTAQGQSSRMIFKDNKMYMIMDSAKMIMVMPATDKTEAGGVQTSDMKLTSSGTAVFGGKSLPYEEYKDPDGDRAQYFLDGNKLAGIRNIMDGGETIDIVISVLDQNVPGNAFDIPTGYQVQDMSDFGQF